MCNICIHIYVGKRKKTGTREQRLGGKRRAKNCCRLRLIEHAGNEKKMNKAKHTHNAYVRRKIQAEERDMLMMYTRERERDET